MRTFDSGAKRDTDEGKLDYIKALSPVALKRYLQYLDEHRLMPDGSRRDFDNWKKGLPYEETLSSLGRHFVDLWLLSHGFLAEDNHGPVNIDDVLCAILFNTMSMLHSIVEPSMKDLTLGE